MLANVKRISNYWRIPEKMPKSTFLKLSDERKEKLRKTIYNMFIKKDYESISIRDLVKEMDISIGSFYKYFDDKAEMYLFFFSEIEKKIFEEEKRRNASFFYPAKLLDLHEILTQEEIDFSTSWLNVPEDVLYKFYFRGHAKQLYRSILDELTEMQQKAQLNPNIKANIAYHIIITSMFSFMLYIKENKITDKEDFFSRKTTYYQTVILPGILSEKYYKQKYSKNAIKSEIIL